MSIDDKNSTTNNEEDSLNFLKDAKIPFTESKEDIWQQMEGTGMFEEEPIKADISYSRPFLLRISKTSWAMAASITIMLGIGLFMRFYSTTVESSRGEQDVCILPDASKVLLNADTKVSFHPYWWNMDRSVQMEGEAFFDVEKGQKFTVYSDNGTTSVHGTSFNISTREDGYKVYCKTGKVEVRTGKSKAIIITPNMSVSWIPGTETLVQSNVTDQAIEWKNGKFSFTATSLKSVFEEIERQYNVTITSKLPLDFSEFKYTGYFEKSKSSESTIGLICESFNLTYKKKSASDNIYIISLAEAHD